MSSHDSLEGLEVVEGAAAKTDSYAPSQDALFGAFVEVGQDFRKKPNFLSLQRK